ncbi:mRNA (guanine-N7-)-methyltransferase [Nematocida homosporus]|uniref:mRNA (guanine-N7-)-methyltransferase n=1 Tax=Nematocida homosporus TaxID=1912981 RepID=UPI00222063B9|nr:mRNA (guanine-N7-)-methyltransferase [Nematocida homosporus]KAI5186366.1 mRNA (guanine-N7-)-methyltransferase [Nematocida homosporus]
MDSQNVARHYNRLSGVGLDKRPNSKIISVREINNFIKCKLIQKYANKNNIIFDLGCGKGGDLSKIKFLPMKHYYGCDIADKSIEEAIERSKSHKFKADFLVADFTRQNIRLESKANLVMAQFSFHYAFQNETTLDKAIKNVSTNLAPNGIFLATIPNPNTIHRRLARNNPSLIIPPPNSTTTTSSTTTNDNDNVDLNNLISTTNNNDNNINNINSTNNLISTTTNTISNINNLNSTISTTSNNDNNISTTSNNDNNTISTTNNTISTTTTTNNNNNSIPLHPFGNSLYRVEASPSFLTHQEYNRAYTFYLEEAIEGCQEYLVNLQILNSKLAKLGIFPILSKDFLDILNEEIRNDQNTYKRMVKHTPSKEEMQIIELYQAIAYRKISTP